MNQGEKRWRTMFKILPKKQLFPPSLITSNFVDVVAPDHLQQVNRIVHQVFHNAGSSHVLSVESAGTSSGCSKYTATPPQSVAALITTTAAPTQSTAALTTTPAAQNRATPAACTPVTAAPFTGTLANVSLLWPRSKQLRLSPLLKQLQVKESLLNPIFPHSTKFQLTLMLIC